MADMVVDEVRRRIAQPLAAGARMEGRRDAELDAFRPDRVVIVLAVDRQHVVMHGGVAGRLGHERARHAAAEHADLRAELLGDEFEFGDRLLGVVHRDDRGRGQPVAEPVEIIGRDDVVGADHRAPGLVVLDARQAQPGGRIDDREIDADLVEPLVEHLRHHRRGAVERVLGLAVPEIRAARRRAGARSAGCSLSASVVDLQRGEEPVGRLVAAGLAHLFAEDRGVFEPMSVAVDDRVRQVRADFGWAGVCGHLLLLPKMAVEPAGCFGGKG